MNKKAIEMSINAIVAIVLAILVFGAGIGIFKSITSKGGDWLEKIDKDLEEKVRLAADDGTPLFVSPASIIIRGEEHEIVYVGVRNILNKKVNVSITANKIMYSGEIDFEGNYTAGLNLENITVDSKNAISRPIMLNLKEFPLGQSTIKVTAEYFDFETRDSLLEKNSLIYITKK
ncbi:hypothetical protein K9L97_01965 [Candidatus Woesearchaeota archaeon]|nr:hypothetical protein [Candidatus Woesearchaeota archaeon]